MPPTFVHLDKQGLLAIKGPDAAVFLNGQSTCAIPAPGHSTPGACCTPSGRMVASFHVAAMRKDLLLLRLPRQMVPRLQDFLEKYIRFSKAAQQDVSETYRLLGLHDPEGAAAAGVFGTLPEATGDCLQIDGGLLLRRDAQRLECWLAVTQAEQYEKKLAAHCAPAPWDAWQLLEIRAGAGEVRSQTVEHFLPQMLNLDQNGGVRFDKGCYTGQEVVTRVQHRGKIKRRMHRLRAAAGSGPAPGTPVYDAQRHCGEALCSAPAEEKNVWELLAVLDTRAAESDALRLDSPQGAQAEILPFCS